jgi:hypothetical protein
VHSPRRRQYLVGLLLPSLSLCLCCGSVYHDFMPLSLSQNPSDVDVYIADHKISEFASESVICAKRNFPALTVKYGAQGDAVGNVNLNMSGSIEFTLKAASPDIGKLASLAEKTTVALSCRLVARATGKTCADAAVYLVEFDVLASHAIRWTLSAEKITIDPFALLGAPD